MTRTSWKELQSKKLSSMTIEERREYDQAYTEAQLAAEVGERIHAAREAASLSQREMARRMGTSQAAIDRLESGPVGTAIGLEDLRERWSEPAWRLPTQTGDSLQP